MTRFRVRKGDLEVEYEGEADEVSKRFEDAMALIRSPKPAASPNSEGFQGLTPDVKVARKSTGEVKLLQERIASLKADGFLRGPKSLSEIRKELQTRGWYHKGPAIQNALLTRSVELQIKRIQEAGGYKYVEM